MLLVITAGVTHVTSGSAAAQNSSSQNTQVRQKEAKAKFLASLPPGFQVPSASDEVATRLLEYYGAVFVARGGTAPPVLEFADEDAVTKWQASLKTDMVTIGQITVELQSAALGAFTLARVEAQAIKLEITPRGTYAAKRGYKDTEKLWKFSIGQGLAHWVTAHRLRGEEANRIKGLASAEQVPEVFHLEDHRLFFGGNFSRTILSSLAPPGASQHISMLAIDINEHESAAVRVILAKHGWFQTVLLDTPHFTYLGVSEQELPTLGLHKMKLSGREYWIPDLGISVDQLLDRRARGTPSAGRNN